MWAVTLPFNPMPTPRPSGRRTAEGVVTFYNDKYLKYMEKVSQYIIDNELLNDSFYKTLESFSGVVMEVDFFLKPQKNQKNMKSIMRLSAPDIDNLLKSAMDCIFNDSGVKDSRVVGVVAFKYNTFGKPRTEIKLKEISELEETLNIMKKKGLWNVSIPFNPVATPRPSFKRVENGLITYYSKKYVDYQEKVKNLFVEGEHYNEMFYKNARAELGTIMEIDYYCKAPKNMREVKNIMKTSAPDIDNLVKATLDGIFNKEIGMRDSRVVGLIAFKYNTIKEPRTEIRMKGIMR